jgi:hypothetical protein
MDIITNGQGAGDVADLRLFDPLDLDSVASVPIDGCPGVGAKTLWQSPDAICALIHYRAGASTPGHPHADAHQHIWIVYGTVVVAGRLLVSGSYVHVLPGVAHPVRALGDHDSVLFQVHQRCGVSRPAPTADAYAVPA